MSSAAPRDRGASSRSIWAVLRDGVPLVVGALVCLAPSSALAASQTTPIPVRFAVDRVEDRYAVNLPGFSELFDFFGIGHAGCSIRLRVRTPEGLVPFGANDKVSLNLKINLIPQDEYMHSDGVGSIDRGEVEIYLFNQCDTIDRISIHDARCFPGFKGEFEKLPCPYVFAKRSISVRDFYLRQRRD